MVSTEILSPESADLLRNLISRLIKKLLEILDCCAQHKHLLPLFFWERHLDKGDVRPVHSRCYYVIPLKLCLGLFRTS